MVWDLFAIYAGFALLITGWNVGLFKSWPAPLAMIAATFGTQCVYLEVAVWLVEQLHVPAELATFIAYAIVWIALEVSSEFAITIIFPYKKYGQLRCWERVAGAAVSLIKYTVLLVFAGIASAATHGVPDPPSYPLVALWLSEASRESVVMRSCGQLATALPPGLVPYVVAQNDPGTTADFRDRTHDSAASERGRQVRDLYASLRQLEKELDR